jgi:hypothetical protein
LILPGNFLALVISLNGIAMHAITAEAVRQLSMIG